MQEFYNTTNAEYLEVCKNLVVDKKIKIEILDHYENTLSEITYDVSNIQGSISVDYQQGIRRTCNFTIRDVDGIYVPKNEDSIFFINRKFKIYLGIKNNDTIYWFSQGVFITTDVSSSNYELQITGKDKFAFFTDDLNQHILQGTYIIPKGTSVRKAISDTITIDMGNGYPTDAIEPLIDMDLFNETLPYDIKKDAGSTISDILIEMATSLNCDIYYNSDGCLVVTKSCIDDYHKIAPQWVFGEHDAENLTTEVNYNMSGIINSITVCGNNTTGQIYEYTAKNEYPTSPLRISLIGVHTREIEETSMGYSLQRCKDYSEYKLKKVTLLALSINKTCSFLPHLDANKIIGLSNSYYGFENQYFITQKLEMPIGNNPMNLSLCNINYLPFIEEGTSTYTNAIALFKEIVLNMSTGDSTNYFAIPIIISENTDFTVAWGDNTPNEQYRYISGNTNVHEYNPNGTYQLTINGGFLASSLKANGTLSDCVSAIIPEGVISIEGLFSSCNKLTSVSLPTTLKTIGTDTFNYCENLTSITIPDSVTDIGEDAFMYCKKLEKIIIPNKVTSIGYQAFGFCYKVEEISIPNSVITCNTSVFSDLGRDAISTLMNIDSQAWLNILTYGYLKYITSIVFGSHITSIHNELFNGDNRLELISLSNSITSIGDDAFPRTKITSIIIPNSVTSVGVRVFQGCSNLTTVSTGILGVQMFQSCSNLTTVVLQSTVTSIPNYAFQYCYNIPNINIPSTVTSIGNYAFFACSKITSITLPNDLISIGEYAFYSCGLINITIPPNVNSVSSSAFSSCNSLTDINVDISNTSYSSDNGCLINSITNEFMLCPKNKTGSLIIGTLVTSIGYQAFSDCSKLTSITIPSSVTNIGGQAFSSCSKLTSISLPSSVTNISNQAFSSCTGLTSFNIPNSIVTIGTNAFEYCSKLTSIIIPNISILNQYTFKGCTSLTSATVNASVISNYAFDGCTALKSVDFGENVSTINIASFSGCNVLSQFTVSENNTKYSASDNMIIENGTKLFLCAKAHTGSISIPSGINTIGTSAFSSIGITGVTFPTSLTTIEANAFMVCNNITSVILPNSLTTIGSSAFYNCSKITSVTFPSTVTSIGTMAFKGTALTSVTIPTNCVYEASGYFASFPTGCVVHKV